MGNGWWKVHDGVRNPLRRGQSWWAILNRGEMVQEGHKTEDGDRVPSGTGVQRCEESIATRMVTLNYLEGR